MLLPIAHDVAMGGITIKEQAIDRAQYLDLVYSQFGVLYEIIKDSPQPSILPNWSTSSSHANGVIGSLNTQPQSPSEKYIQKTSKSSKSKVSTTSTLSYFPYATLDVNFIQSSKFDK